MNDSEKIVKLNNQNRLMKYYIKRNDNQISFLKDRIKDLEKVNDEYRSLIVENERDLEVLDYE